MCLPRCLTGVPPYALDELLMTSALLLYPLGAAAIATLAPKALARMRLSRAKHPSLQGHARIARLLARVMPFLSIRK